MTFTPIEDSGYIFPARLMDAAAVARRYSIRKQKLKTKNAELEDKPQHHLHLKQMKSCGMLYFGADTGKVLDFC